MRRRCRSGFTWMELLVVVSIIVILAAILFPVFAQAQDAARRSRGLSNLRQLALAHHLYVQDYDDTLPAWQIISPRRTRTLWTEFLQPYYRDPGLLDQHLTCPADKRRMGWQADYALASWGPAGRGTVDDPYWRWPGSPWLTPQGQRPMRLAEVLRPSEAAQLADGYTTRESQYSTGCMIRRRYRNGLLSFAFLDGHARVVTDPEWNRVDQDARGYFYVLSAADR